jgi:hypothetical protein
MVSVAQAFALQGVELTFPQRSLSGVRADDGCVLIAIRDTDIRACLEGFSCLLYAPAAECAAEPSDRPGWRERLEHCRLAARHGGAEGLVVCGNSAQVDPGLLLVLRVEKRRTQYWALWGSAALAPALPPRRRVAQLATV